MMQELGREPTVDEVAAAVEMSPERVREIRRIALEPLSLESPIGEEEDSSLGDFVEDPRHAGSDSDDEDEAEEARPVRGDPERRVREVDEEFVERAGLDREPETETTVEDRDRPRDRAAEREAAGFSKYTPVARFSIVPPYSSVRLLLSGDRNWCRQ